VLKPNPFDGKNFLIWKAKMELWLTAVSCFHAAEGKPADLPPENEAKFKAEDNLFRGAVISALDTKLQKSYIILPTGKELWDALVGKFGVTDAGSELYLMEQLYDYKMVENCWDHASSPKVLQEETPSANLFIRDTEATVHEASIL
jgi:hypothetical protein